MIIPSSPILMHYYITYRCNCRCSFCDLWQTTCFTNIPDAKLENIQDNLVNGKKLGIKFVDFTGGEPLLHNDIHDILTAAKRIGLRTSITTNCLLYPEKSKEMAGLVDYLHFSLDSILPEQHNLIRNEDVFDQVVQSIDLARSIGERPDLLYTVTNQNIHQIGFLSEFAKKMGLVLIINPVFLCTCHKNSKELDSILPSNKKMDAFFQRFVYTF